MCDLRLENNKLFATSSIAINGFCFDSKSKLFVKEVISTDQLASFPDKVFRNPKFLALVQANLTKLKDHKKDAIIPNTVHADLYHHQKEAVAFILSRNKCILASDLGLGKTLIVLTSLAVLKSGKILVICPAALKTNWLREIAKYVPSFKAIAINSKKDAVLKLQPHSFQQQTIIVISYQLACSCSSLLLSQQWDFLACDEAHAVKNHKSKRSKVVAQIAKKTPRCVLMSGTPCMKVRDLWHPLKIVEPGIFSEFYTYESPRGMKCLAHSSEKHFYFADRYIIPEVKPIGGGRKVYVFKTQQRLFELHALTHVFILRQKKEDCLSLPPFLREYVTVCNATPTQQKVYERELTRIEELRKTNKFDADAAFMALVRTTSQLKSKAVLEYLLLQCELLAKQKIIIFVYHHSMSSVLHTGLEKRGIGHILVNGETKTAQRDTLLKQFEQDPNTRVGVLSLGVCSTGLNLTFCQFVLCSELTFDAIQHHQSESRCYRIGQEKKVVFQYLGMDGSTDSTLWRSLLSKVNTSANILDS